MLSKFMASSRPVRVVLVAITLLALLIPASPVAADDWSVGKIVGLCKGTQIREGPGTEYRAHTTVPENDWAVKITNGPRNGDWWDTSRKAAGDPSGGTGWVKKSEAESCKSSALPSHPPSPAAPELTSGVSLSRGQVYPGDRIEGSFAVRNAGGEDWRAQRLGIGVNGPSYLDFGWQQVTIRPGDSHSFQGAIVNAPGQLGTYVAYAAWQDEGGNWHRLGGDSSFTIVSRPGFQQPPPPQAQPSSAPSPNTRAPATQPPRAQQPVEQPSAVQPQVDFRADSTAIASMGCTTLRWDVENVRAVYLDGQGVTGHGTKYVCPLTTQVYTLRILVDGGELSRSVTITVAPNLGPPEISAPSAQLTDDARAKADESYDKLSTVIDYALDCIPAVGGEKVRVIKGIGTANDVRAFFTDPEKIPALVKLSLNLVPGSEPVQCIFSLGQNMEFQFWLENRAVAGLWWLEGDFEKMWPAYSHFVDCLPLPNNDRTDCR